MVSVGETNSAGEAQAADRAAWRQKADAPPGLAVADGLTPRRSSAAARQRRRRERARAGQVIALTPVDGCILDTLVVLGWLDDSDTEDRTAIGAAIFAMLHDLAKHR